MKNYHEEIDAFLHGGMTHSEMEVFRARFEASPELKDEVILHHEVEEAVTETNVMALREQLHEIHQKQFEQRNILSWQMLKNNYRYVAASVVILIAASILFLKQHQQNPDTIYKQYYESYSASSFRSGVVETDQILEQAILKYKQEDYHKAISLFEQILEERKKDPAINLYSGISYMEIEKYANASNSFQTIINLEKTLFEEQARWYLALCCLKTEKLDKAEQLLDELIQNDSYYREDAEAILKKLK